MYAVECPCLSADKRKPELKSAKTSAQRPKLSRKLLSKFTNFPCNPGPDVYGRNRPDVVGTQNRAVATMLHCVVYCLDTGIPASSLC